MPDNLNFKFKDLVEIPVLSEMLHKLYNVAGIPSAIIDMEGNILTWAGGERICEDFYRKHPEAEKICIQSDIKIREKISQGSPYAIYKCPHGLFDSCAPIVIAGHHIANIFTGQILHAPLDDDTIEEHKILARKYGFDENDYLKALREVRVFPVEKHKEILDILSLLAGQIAQMGLTNLRMIEQSVKLLAQEKILNKSQEIAHLGSWHLDMKKNALTWSDETYRIFGRAPQEFGATYEAFIETIHPDDRDMVREAYTKAIENKQPYECIHRIVRGDGEIRIVFEKSEDVVDENGDVIHSFGFTQDITEQTQLADALREREIEYAYLYNHLVDAVFILSLNGHFLDANEVALKRLGYDLAEFTQMTPADINSPELSSGFKGRLKELLKTGYIHYETVHVTKSGAHIPTEITGSLITYRGEKAVLVLARDITSRKEAEDKLRKSEDTLKSIYTAAPVGIGVLVDRFFQNVNRHFTVMVGYQLEEIIGKKARILYESDLEFIRVGNVKYHQILQTGTGEVETKWVCKDGSIIDINLRSTAIDPNDLKKGVVFTALDITDRKKTQALLKKNNEELESRVRNRTLELNEANIALKVLLQQSSEAKEVIERKIETNINNLVFPYLLKLKRAGLSPQEESYVEIVRSNLSQITSSFSQRIIAKAHSLTPREIEVAHLIKMGKTTKEIAELLHLSPRTIETHRDKLRHKLGIKELKGNLRSYLTSHLT